MLVVIALAVCLASLALVLRLSRVVDGLAAVAAEVRALRAALAKPPPSGSPPGGSGGALPARVRSHSRHSERNAPDGRRWDN